MKTTLLVVVLFIVSTLTVYSLAAESVLTLTEKNFDSTVNEADISLVEFYAPWCGHCKTLAPEFERAAQILKSNDPPVILGKVDATEEKSLGDRFSVQGYPTLFVFRKGKQSEYKGPRDAAGIVSYMQKQAAPTITNIADAKSFTTYKSSKGVAGPIVVGVFSDKTSKLYQSFQSIANALREEFSFALVSDPKLIPGGSASDNSIHLFKIDNSQVTYNPSTHGLDLSSFINSNSFAVGSEYTETNSKSFTSQNLPILKLYIPIDYSKPSSIKKVQYYQRRLQKLPNLDGKLLVTVANKDAFIKDPSSYGLTAVPEHLLVIEKGNAKYVDKSTSFNSESLNKFVNDFLGNKLESFVKSEEVEAAEEGKVVKVVGRNFDEIVEDASKNVMIEFYAPWCGHCKTLAPIYDELAQKRANKKGGKDNETVIAKLDATANDWNKDKYNVNGFPTIFFKTKSGKIEQYNGERTVKAMDKFINSHAE